ncbi:MAG: response regulator [Janthinobacterium lividum]
MKRRILLVDDEVAVLLTLKAVLEISGFDVDTATSAREGKSRIKHREYEMVITDMRMEDEHAGREVIAAAKEASYVPAVALLTAFPVDEEALGSLGADKMLVKPMHTRVLLQQLEALFTRHTAAKAKAQPKKSVAEVPSAAPAKAAARKTVVKGIAAKGTAAKETAAQKTVTTKSASAKAPAKSAKAAAKKAAR